MAASAAAALAEVVVKVAAEETSAEVLAVAPAAEEPAEISNKLGSDHIEARNK